MKAVRTVSYISAIAIALLASCKGGEEQTNTEADAKAQVKVEASRIAPVENVAEFTGSVEAFRQNHIAPSVPVRIDKIYVEVGDMVTENQLLVQMDNAQLHQAKVQLDNLELDYKRLDTLYRVGSIPQQQVDQIRTQLEVARTSYNNLKENTQLRSPINGIVTSRHYNDGELYSPTPTATGKAAVITVMQLKPVKVLINVSEEYFPNVRQGMGVKVMLDIYPGKEFDGKIHLIYPTIDPATRTFTIEVTVPNSDLAIRPGMFARVKLNFGTMEQVLVSDLAIIKQAGTNDRYVFTVTDGVATRKQITLGRRVGSSYVVLSGLKANEQVVIAGQAKLLDQSMVEIVK